ncbi:MAG: hypothetical protein AABZ39_20405 [Spirochaetota bacterium]
MLLTRELSAKQRAIGAQKLLRFVFLNGIGFNFIGETSVVLLAMQFNASNIQIGYLNSCFHITGIIAILAPSILARARVISVFYHAWTIRGFICILYVLTLFFSGQSAVMIILVVFTVFNIFRTVGVAMLDAVNRSLVPPNALGAYVARTNTQWLYSAMIAQTACFLLLSYKPLAGVAGLVLIQCIGTVFNTLGTRSVRDLPVRDRIPAAAGMNIFSTAIRVLKDKEMRILFIIYSLNLTLFIMLAFTIPFLRKVVGLGSNIIFLYTIFMTLAALLASRIIRPFTDRIGKKPILLITSGTGIFIALGWAFIPATARIPELFALGAVTIFFSTMNGQTINALMLRAMPSTDKANYSFMVRFLSAIIALGAGFAAGLIADAGAHSHMLVHPFMLTFITAAFIYILLFAISTRITEHKSLSIMDSARFIITHFNPDDILDVRGIINTISQGMPWNSKRSRHR